MLPALAACALAILLILPFKLTAGCGPLPPPWWAYAPVLTLLPIGALTVLVGRRRWNLSPRQVAPVIGLFTVSVAIVLLPELNVFWIVTTC